MSALVTFAFVEGGSEGLGAELPRRPDRANVLYHHFAPSSGWTCCAPVQADRQLSATPSKSNQCLAFCRS